LLQRATTRRRRPGQSAADGHKGQQQAEKIPSHFVTLLVKMYSVGSGGPVLIGSHDTTGSDGGRHGEEPRALKERFH
jgi:hypothetical protein